MFPAADEFRALMEASRTQFEAEVRSLLPDVKIGEKSDKLTTDELNLLLAHAHRKVLALQKSLAKQQVGRTPLAGPRGAPIILVEFFSLWR